MRHRPEIQKRRERALGRFLAHAFLVTAATVVGLILGSLLPRGGGRCPERDDPPPPNPILQARESCVRARLALSEGHEAESLAHLSQAHQRLGQIDMEEYGEELHDVLEALSAARNTIRDGLEGGDVALNHVDGLLGELLGPQAEYPPPSSIPIPPPPSDSPDHLQD